MMKSDTESDPFATRRLRMVHTQIESRGVRSPTVLAAMGTVPRHLFVPEELIPEAYDDGPLEIGHGQTISQPYIVASMTEHLAVGAGSRVLEIGTGCGYQTAVLASLGCEVYSVEIIPELQEQAVDLVRSLGFENVKFLISDGYLGWPKHAPYDGIIVTAAAPTLPESFESQLKENGRIVIPLEDEGKGGQGLYLYKRKESGLDKQYLYGVRFVRMTGDTGGAGKANR